MTPTEFLSVRLAEDSVACGLDALPASTDMGALTRDQREAMAKVALLAALVQSAQEEAHNPKGSLEDRLRYAYHEGEKCIAQYTLRLMCLPYADHPDYQAEWTP